MTASLLAFILSNSILKVMCCFSRPVEKVSNTRIFARLDDEGRQFLIYQMTFHAREDLAMVLPVPVMPGADENAMTFFSFQNYASVFDDLHKGFPAPQNARTYSADPFGAAPQNKLKVISVGAYDASFVPGITDFSRLDERFRLPDQVWKHLPGYAHFGFAVFKLKAGNAKAHPMAFTFPTSRKGHLFFPTLHIHDGHIHDKEDFNHTLYAQPDGQRAAAWEESPSLAVAFVKCGLTHGFIQPDKHVRRRVLQERMSNGDIVLKTA